jgi:hypothetical protein
MADTAAHLVDRVLPEVPIRQWVLTLPYRLRYRCAYDARLTSEVLRAFVRSLFAELRRRARRRWGVRAPQCGAVTFVQRFGSAPNLNVHFHTLVLDGVYRYAPEHDGRVRFLPLPSPEPDEVGRVPAGSARRIQRVIEARNADDEDALARAEPLLALLATASLRTRIATGTHRGEPWRRLERLCRCVARPPLARERLEERPDGRLALRLKTRWRDGTTHILMERSELIERLVPLIPPSRAHQVRYHGILAPSASMRDRIVPHRTARPLEGKTSDSAPAHPPPTLDDSQMCAISPSPIEEGRRPSGCSRDRPETPGEPPKQRHGVDGEPREPGIREPAGRMRWAALLQRVFEVDALRCRRCGSTMRLVAAIEDPKVARRILECLDLPARAPPLGEAAGGNDETFGLQDDRLFDQSTGHDEP